MSQDIIDLGYVLLLCVSVYLVCRYLVFPLISKLANKTKTILDDVLLDKKFLNRVSLVIVFSSLKSYVDAVNSIPFIDRVFSEILINSFLAIFIGLSISELLTIINKISTHYDSLKNKPIKGYIQIVKIIVNAFIVIIIFAIATGQPVAYYISGLGAITAILLLVFQDTILSFVASVQIGQNDIINLNDWIEVPEYGADGDVIDISLHTVKVQNWDKTITTIPTSKIVTSSVKNWRGMSDYGGRRIMRSILIDISSVRFMEDKDIEKLKKLPSINKYLKGKIKDIEDHNSSINKEVEERRLTNLGTLRAYLINYLKNHEELNTDDMTLIVRQLSPTSEGVPLEIYTFTKTIDWVEYESVQSDIFDHIFAVLPKFGLRAFQSGLLEAAAVQGMPINEPEI
jgi:miniconductance mechanosensitive channel